MAREESEREDLLRDATALVERIELVFSTATTSAENIVVGFRRDGRTRRTGGGTGMLRSSRLNL